MKLSKQKSKTINKTKFLKNKLKTPKKFLKNRN